MIELKNVKACLFAGGLGTRLRKVIADRPKPMAEVQGRPLLEYVMLHLAKQGIKQFIFSIGYLGEMIEAYFQDGAKWGVKIEYVREKELLGTGGGLLLAKDLFSEPAIIGNGDTLLEINVVELLKFHQENKADWTIAVRLAQQEINDPMGKFIVNDQGQILKLQKDGLKQKGEYINGGTYCVSPNILDSLNPKEVCSLEKDLLPDLMDRNAKLFIFPTQGFFCDIGTPDDYQNLCKTGVPVEYYSSSESARSG
ncbi:MAG: sugar phosphate nucleotidyltransferase [Pseudomonadota bacterium]